MAQSLNGGISSITVLKSGFYSGYSSGNTEGYSKGDYTNLKSVNSPITFQLKWTKAATTNLTPFNSLVDGDLVNVVFEVWLGKNGNSDTISSGNMIKVAEIRKPKDVPYNHNEGIGQGSGYSLPYVTYTIDVAPILKDYLTYTLTPIGKGQSAFFGELSGTYSTNNVLDYKSIGGSYRTVIVRPKFEVKDGDLITEATSSGTTQYKGAYVFGVVNTVNQWEDNWNDLRYYNVSCTNSDNKKFFSNAPNGDGGTPHLNLNGYKSIRVEDEAEWLSFMLHSVPVTTSICDISNLYIKIETDDGNTSLISVIGDSFSQSTLSGVFAAFGSKIRRYITQNVSPSYINSEVASTITSSTKTYSVGLWAVETSAAGSAQYYCTEKRYYTIDRETESAPYGFVRFHWLNRKGGIDSYTAKRDVSETVNVNKTFFERKSPDKNYLHETSASDSQGGDNYKSSVEIYNIDATRKNTVFTEPLNNMNVKWIEELFTSPNVWVELENEASKRANAVNSTTHPSTKDYFPVTINNSDVSIVSQEDGLVKFNIGYTHSHKINTQSN